MASWRPSRDGAQAAADELGEDRRRQDDERQHQGGAVGKAPRGSKCSPMPTRKNGTSSSVTPLVSSWTRRSTVSESAMPARKAPDDGGHAGIDGQQRQRRTAASWRGRTGPSTMLMRASTRGTTRCIVRVPHLATKTVKPRARAAVSARSEHVDRAFGHAAHQRPAPAGPSTSSITAAARMIWLARCLQQPLGGQHLGGDAHAGGHHGGADEDGLQPRLAPEQRRFPSP